MVEQIMGITVEVNAEISLHLLMDRHRSISEAKLVMEGAEGEASWGLTSSSLEQLLKRIPDFESHEMAQINPRTLALQSSEEEEDDDHDGDGDDESSSKPAATITDASVSAGSASKPSAHVTGD